MRRKIFKVLQLFTPHWQAFKKPDPNHFYRRKFTKHYHRKKDTVKNVWIAAGCVMFAFPVIQFIIPTILFTSFIAFCILDET